ncbi:MAG: PKD domain-containing protein [Bacteroidales bacterium]|nr:PKD domain-containing protein [Bacteroidales bacterium]
MKYLHLLLVSFVLLYSVNLQSQTVSPYYLDGEIYVKFKNEHPLNVPTDRFGEINFRSIEFLSDLSEQFEITRVYKSFYFSKDYNLLQTVRIEFGKAEHVMDLIREIQSLPSIEYAEPVPYLQNCLTPNDMGTNNVSNGTWHLYKINAQQAWDISTGSTNVKVAVVDNAVQTNHPDLAANMLAGWDVADNDNDPNPPATTWDHGTHVAGIASAATNNGVGVASIGYTVKIIPVKSTNSNTNISHGYEGVTWAANNGADVINMSWGGEGSSTTALNVINAAYNLGCVLIAAAGNSGDDGNPVFYPAAYANCIAVANTTSTDAKAASSQYGTWVDVAAPGTSIKSSIPTSSYAVFSGTSMASPLVAGLCGLMLSVNPSLTQTQVRTCLLNSVDNIDAQNPSYIGQIGSGRINAYQALVCVNATVNALDAGISSIIAPGSTLCAASYTPIVKLKNFGSTTLTTAAIKYKVDNGSLLNYNWNGSLTSNSEVNVTLPTLTATQGSHTFKAYTTLPNNGTDQNNANDTLATTFYYYGSGLSLPFTENFESNSFATNNWTITNPDNSITWSIETTAGAIPGDKSAKLDFYNYSTAGERDGLQTPPLNFTGYSSASLTFHHAYRRYDQTATDSLIIYVSTDCGTTFPYRVLAKGENGQGVFATTSTSTAEFTPTIDTVWCFAGTIGSACYTVDLSAYVGNPKVIIKFEGYNNYQNNLYLDNINITGVQASTPPTPNFTANKTNICKGDTVTFTDLSTPAATTWTWTFPGGTPSSSNLQNPTVIYNTAGNYNVTLLAGNTAGSNTLTNNNYITVNALPTVPTITQNVNILSTSATNVTYEWFLNGVAIPNSNTSSITATVSGAYTVQVTNTSGCKATSVALNFIGTNPYDAGITVVTNPTGTICSGSIVPVVTIKNFGTQTLTSAVIKYRIDNGTLNTFNWTGSLTTNNTASVTLNTINTTAGAHVFKTYTTLPNGYTDTNTSNDTITSNFTVSASGASLPFTENFQSGVFTTNNWTVSNPDAGITWDIFTTNGTFTGNMAARMRFFNYTTTGQRDAMVTTPLNFNGYSAIQLSFDHAYKRKNTNSTDSLLIYVSTDCGLTYPNKVFAKGQGTTVSFATAYTGTTEFTPVDSTEWCMGPVGADCFSVDLSSFAGNPSVMIKFESYNNYQNNLYIDNINISGTPVALAPVANFVANATNIATGGSVNFTDLSTNTPTSWSWTFAGGTPGTSSAQNPTNIVYNTPGTYNVTLIATNANGSDTELKTSYITVTGVAPVANFMANNTAINTGGSVNFTDLSTNTPTSWSWTFAGGTPGTSTVQNPSNIVYNSPGTYNVTLVATNAFGNDTELKTGYIVVTTAGTAPVANFVANNTAINTGGSVNFTDLSTNTPTSWSWTFAGGTPGTSTVQNPSNIVYNSPGTYNVTLVATNAFGNDTELKTGYIVVTTAGTAPVANFIANNTSINTGGSVNFTDLSTNTPTSWSWTFAGGTPGTSTVQNPTNIVYNSPGTYNVTLVATNAFGNDTELKTGYIVVNSPGTAPDANFIANSTTINTGGNVNFTDLSLNTPTSWSWTFAGGTPSSSSAQNPANIVYNTPGTYDVTLVATNAFGNDTELKVGYITVNSSGVAPVVDFVANNTTIGSGGSVNFTDLSINSPTSWSWTFAGGTPGSSNIQNPVNIIYNTPGTYDVTLVATNAFGNDTELKVGYITVTAGGSAPVVDFIADNIIIVAGQNANFTDLSINNPTSWLWSFEGGTPSSATDQNPSAILYNIPGTYYVTLIATNIYGTGYLNKASYITVIPNTSIQDREDANSVNIYPNPAHEKVFIEVVGDNESYCMIKLYNVIGQSISEQQIYHLSSGINKFEYDISGLPKGIYYFEVETLYRKSVCKTVVY